MPQGACRGYGTIRPATPTDCRYAESIHRICHRPAASRASKTHFSGLGPPWRSHPCIEGYPQCQWVRDMAMRTASGPHWQSAHQCALALHELWISAPAAGLSAGPRWGTAGLSAGPRWGTAGLSCPAPGGAPPACRPAPGGTPRRCHTCARGGTARGLP